LLEANYWLLKAKGIVQMLLSGRVFSKCPKKYSALIARTTFCFLFSVDKKFLLATQYKISDIQACS
jgi:hypothetical protein